jgi:mannose-6-phosphate isomerase-like protein (cupin superfamily)
MLTTFRLDELFNHITTFWDPHIVCELNGQHIKIAKVKGDFIWHSHAHEDELFYIHKGHLNMRFRDRTVEMKAGDWLVVPKGIEHQPSAPEETCIVLIEPIGTMNTGEIINERTIHIPKTLGG